MRRGRRWRRVRKGRRWRGGGEEGGKVEGRG